MARGLLIAAALLAGACTGFTQTPATARIAHDDIVVQSGDVRLAARTSYPDRPGRHPAVVRVHGSGRAGRDQYCFDWQRSRTSLEPLPLAHRSRCGRFRVPITRSLWAADPCRSGTTSSAGCVRERS